MTMRSVSMLSREEDDATQNATYLLEERLKKRLEVIDELIVGADDHQPVVQPETGKRC